MSSRFFTSDLHFNSFCLITEKSRPFKTVESMNETLIRNINSMCSVDDMLISCGDVCQFGKDREYGNARTKPGEFIGRINPTFVNIKGNHDDNNKVKSFCDSMRTTLGRKYVSVSVGHYPSFDPRATGSFRRGDIRIHGHIHCKRNSSGELIIPPKYTIDFKNKVLNINVNCELWNFRPVSEDRLIHFVDWIMRTRSNRKIHN